MENKHKLSINQWAPEDRPREKMIEKGAAALSDAELLAILIGSGNTEESAVELMRRLLLSCDNNLNTLAKWEVCDYSRFKGMGPAKSITVMAALELGKRRKLQNIRERLRLKRYLRDFSTTNVRPGARRVLGTVVESGNETD